MAHHCGWTEDQQSWRSELVSMTNRMRWWPGKNNWTFCLENSTLSHEVLTFSSFSFLCILISLILDNCQFVSCFTYVYRRGYYVLCGPYAHTSSQDLRTQVISSQHSVCLVSMNRHKPRSMAMNLEQCSMASVLCVLKTIVQLADMLMWCENSVPLFCPCP